MFLSKPLNELSKASKGNYVNKGMECISVILNIHVFATGQEDTLLYSILKDSNTRYTVFVNNAFIF